MNHRNYLELPEDKQKYYEDCYKVAIGEMNRCEIVFKNLDNEYYILLTYIKSTRIFGCAKCSNTINAHCLSVNEKLLDKKHKEKLINTIIHELLHIYCTVELKKKCGHRGEWKQLANKISRLTNYEIRRLGSKEEGKIFDGEYKYVVNCKECDNVWKYKNKIRFVKSVEKGNIIGYRCKCGCKDFVLIK